MPRAPNDNGNTCNSCTHATAVNTHWANKNRTSNESHLAETWHYWDAGGLDPDHLHIQNKVLVKPYSETEIDGPEH